MPTLSSHVLDSVHGTHAAGLQVEASSISSTGRTPLFSLCTNSEGRISAEIEIPRGETMDVEIVFHTRDYFELCTAESNNVRDDEFALSQSVKAAKPALKVVVVRMSLSADVPKYHAPLVLSPHSYTLWWS